MSGVIFFIAELRSSRHNAAPHTGYAKYGRKFFYLFQKAWPGLNPGHNSAAYTRNNCGQYIHCRKPTVLGVRHILNEDQNGI